MTAAGLLPPLRETLENAGLWRQSAVVLVALSGGGDSVALLHACVQARAQVGLQVWACHVQHGLRGESSLLDEAFVRELCARLQIPLRVMQAELAAAMDTPGVETLARQRRRELLAACMEQVGAGAVLLAHHLDDQAETVLMRLLRGAGARGLGGMAPCVPFGRGVMLRPFLGLKKQSLLEALEQLGQPYREDESNALCVTPRNTLRLRELPALEELFPGAAKHVAEAADSLREDEACLAALAEQVLQTALLEKPGVFALRLEPPPPQAVALRALRRFYRLGLERRGLCPQERDLSREQSLELLELCAAPGGTALNLPCGLQALRGAGHLHLRMQDGQPLTPPPGRVLRLADALGPACPEGRTLCFGGLELDAAPAEAGCLPPRSPKEILIPFGLLHGCVLRYPLPGDELHPFGAPGGKPLRRYLTDRKLDEPFRRVLPLLAHGCRVLWIPGLCAAEELRAAGTEDGLWRLRLRGNEMEPNKGEIEP